MGLVIYMLQDKRGFLIYELFIAFGFVIVIMLVMLQTTMNMNRIQVRNLERIALSELKTELVNSIGSYLNNFQLISATATTGATNTVTFTFRGLEDDNQTLEVILSHQTGNDYLTLVRDDGSDSVTRRINLTRNLSMSDAGINISSRIIGDREFVRLSFNVTSNDRENTINLFGTKVVDPELADIPAECLVRNATELSNIRQNACTTYYLANNINLSGVNWTTIPTLSSNLNGRGFTISNFTHNNGFINNSFGNIRNLTFSNCTVTANTTSPVGCLANQASNVDNVRVAGSVTNTGNGDTGGIVGRLRGGTHLSPRSEITRSSSAVTVTGRRCVGGLVGYVGLHGFVGTSFTTGNVEGVNIPWGAGVGGIAGCLDEASSVNNVYVRGNITGTQNVGGIAGICEQNNGCDDGPGIYTAYFAGSTLTRTGTGNFGPITTDSDVSLSSTLWINNVTFNPTAGRNNFGTSIASATLRTPPLPSGFISSVWRINQSVNNGYPCLIGVTPGC